MEFLPAELQQYAEDHSEPESDLLQKINRETHLHVLKPRMLSGHLQGRVLSMFSHLIRPEAILEIGTYTGYATLCMAEGMQENGRLVTIELNEEIGLRARQYFDESPYNNQIELLIGNARKLIPSLSNEWDLVFIDADKKSYADYYDMVVPQMKVGGCLIADNILWSGKVSDAKHNDEVTESIRAFNLKVTQDNRVQNVLFPIRDGLMVIRKVKD